MAELRVRIYAVGGGNYFYGIYVLTLERPDEYTAAVWRSVQKPNGAWLPIWRAAS